MKVRGKFYVRQKTEIPVWGANGYDSKVTIVDLSAIFESAKGIDGNAVEENRVFATHTPSADIKMSIANQSAADGFETGKAYYVDFTPAE